MSTTPQDPRPAQARAQRPPTWATTLPVILGTFLTSMLIDLTTDWHFALRWIVAIMVGVAVGAVVLAAWQRSRSGRR